MRNRRHSILCSTQWWCNLWYITVKEFKSFRVTPKAEVGELGDMPRNRGRRRNRRGRGGGGGHHGGRNAKESQNVEVVDEGLVFDCKEVYDQNVVTILTELSSFKQHYDAQCSNKQRYLAILLACQSTFVSFSDSSKAKALAAAWARKDYELAETLLEFPDEEFALKEVLTAVTILDSGRLHRATIKRIRLLNPQRCKFRKIFNLCKNSGSSWYDVPPVSDVSFFSNL